MPRALVITVSDRAAAGTRADASGPAAVEALRAAGWDCADPVVIADGAESVEQALRAVPPEVGLVVTTGGTGVGPRDLTPEGTARVLTRAVPGIPEALRREGAVHTPAAVLSRGIAGVVDRESGGTLVVNLPGSAKAVAEGMPVILSVASHVVDQLTGGDHA